MKLISALIVPLSFGFCVVNGTPTPSPEGVTATLTTAKSTWPLSERALAHHNPPSTLSKRGPGELEGALLPKPKKHDFTWGNNEATRKYVENAAPEQIDAEEDRLCEMLRYKVGREHCHRGKLEVIPMRDPRRSRIEVKMTTRYAGSNKAQIDDDGHFEPGKPTTLIGKWERMRYLPPPPRWNVPTKEVIQAYAADKDPWKSQV